MSKDTDAKANEDETKSQLSSHSSESQSNGEGRLKIDLDEDDQPASTKNKSPTSTKIKAQPVTPVKEPEKLRQKVELKRELEELNLTNFGGSQTSQDSVEKPKIKRRNDRGLDGGYWSQMAELNDSGRKRRRTNILDSSELEISNDDLQISQKELDQLNTGSKTTKTDLHNNTTGLIHTPSKNVKLFLSKYKDEIQSGGDLFQIFSIFEKQTIGDYVLAANRRMMQVPENYTSNSTGELTCQQVENKENVPKKISATVPHFAYLNDRNKLSQLIIFKNEPPILPMEDKIFSEPDLKKGFKYLPTEDSIFNFLAKEYLNNFYEKKAMDEQLAKSHEKFYLTNNYIYPLTEWIEIPYNFTLYENNGKANHKTYSLYEIIISVTARLWVLRYILHSYTDTPCYFSTRSKSMQQINSVSISCRDCELCYQIQFNYRRNACRIYSNNPLFMHQHNNKIIYDKKKIN